MDCPGCNGPLGVEKSAVITDPTTVTPVVKPFIVGAGFTSVRRPTPALLRSSVITTEEAWKFGGLFEGLVTCTR